VKKDTSVGVHRFGGSDLILSYSLPRSQPLSLLSRPRGRPGRPPPPPEGLPPRLLLPSRRRRLAPQGKARVVPAAAALARSPVGGPNGEVSSCCGAFWWSSGGRGRACSQWLLCLLLQACASAGRDHGGTGFQAQIWALPGLIRATHWWRWCWCDGGVLVQCCS
jgi:hypothetical protein